MRLIQFLKWWWIKHDWFDRALALFFIFAVLPTAISSIFIGAKSILLLLIIAISILIGMAVYGIFYAIRSNWKDFNEENPPDDVRIMRKLKGLE